MGLPSSLTAIAPARFNAREIGQLLACAADGGGCDGKDIHQRAALRSQHPLRDLDRVVDGNGIGHRANGSKTARGRGSGAGDDALLVRLPGLAQMDMQID